MRNFIKILLFISVNLSFIGFLNAETITLQYDQTNQVKKVSYSGGTATYQYDAVGNRLKKTVSVLSFTNDPLIAGVLFKAEHVIQLRNAVDTLRYNLFSLEPYPWDNDPSAPVSGGPILVTYIRELRIAIADLYGKFTPPRTPPTWQDDPIYSYSEYPALATPIKAKHIQELREAIKDIW
jgi:hypothetical protein